MTLAEARELAGLNKSDLDEKAGLPKGTTHDLESGRNRRPAHDVVTRIVRALRKAGLQGVTAEQLFPVPERVARAS